MSNGSKALNTTTRFKVYQFISQAILHYDTTGSTQDQRESTTPGLEAKKEELLCLFQTDRTTEQTWTRKQKLSGS